MCDPDCDCWMHDDDIDRDIIVPRRKKKGRCKPYPPLQRRSDLDNGPWVGIHKKSPPLPLYEEALKILIKEKLLPPNDHDLVTWSPTNYCKPISPPKPIEPIPCFNFSSSTSEYDQHFPVLEWR